MIINQQCEDLGVHVYNKGCKCQARIAVLVENDNVINYRLLSKKPCHIKTLKNYWGKDRIKEVDGKLIYESYDNELIPLSNWHKTEKTETGWLIHEECTEFNDMIWLYDDKISKELGNGIHIIVVEFGCWADYVWDYGCYEGDGDYSIKVLKSKLKR